MTNKVKIMGGLEKELVKAGQGVLLVVKLLNRDELNILIDDISSITDKFYLMVEKACAKANEYAIVKTPDLTKLFIVVKGDTKVAEKLAYSVYSQVQLYVDSDFPESYLKCAVGSIKFSKDRGIKVDRLVSMMMYGMYMLQDRS